MYIVVELVFRPPFDDPIVRLREDPMRNVSHFRFQNRPRSIVRCEKPRVTENQVYDYELTKSGHTIGIFKSNDEEEHT